MSTYNPNAHSMFQRLIATTPVTPATKMERLLDMIDNHHIPCAAPQAHAPHVYHLLSEDGVSTLWCDGRVDNR